MNRTLALLIPAVLLAGMALIIFQQMNGSENLDPVSVSSLSSQTNASNDLLPAGIDGSQTGQQTGIVPPPVGTSGEQLNATSTATPQTGSLSGANEPNTSTTRSELGRLADAQGAQSTTSAAPGSPQASSQAATQATTAPDAKPKDASAPATAATTTEAKPAETTPQADLPKHKMQSMSFKYQGSEILFIMKAGEHFEYKTFLLPSPDRLVIDLAGAWTGLEAINAPSNRLVKGVRLGKLEKGHRVVLDLKEVPKGYETSRDGNNVTVRIY